MANLKTNYKNDVLDITMDGKRRYQQIDNADGTVSLVDKTVYSQLGDNLGADDINAQNEAINELNNNLTSMVETKYDAESGQPMWKDKGADTWNFFSNYNYDSVHAVWEKNKTLSIPTHKKAKFFIMVTYYNYVHTLILNDNKTSVNSYNYKGEFEGNSFPCEITENAINFTSTFSSAANYDVMCIIFY